MTGSKKRGLDQITKIETALARNPGEMDVEMNSVTPCPEVPPNESKKSSKLVKREQPNIFGYPFAQMKGVDSLQHNFHKLSLTADAAPKAEVEEEEKVMIGAVKGESKRK